MTPNFILDLSSDGLRLSHLAADGWQLVGTADIEGESPATELDALRNKAIALETGGLRCRLALPGDQVRYLSFDAAGLSADAINTGAAAALEGVTVYAVRDLVYDTTLIDDRCHVAAVARETLEEAESFAAAHGFTPVSFCARPEAPEQGWEPDFGLSAWAKEAAADNDTTSEQATDAKPNEQADPGPSSVESPVNAPTEPLFTSRRAATPATPQAGQAPPAFLPTSAETPQDYTVPGFAAAQTPFEHRPALAEKKPGSRTSGPRPDTAHSAPRARHQTSGRQELPEAERLTIFGARGAAEKTARRSGLVRMMVASLVLGGLAVGAWSAGVTPLRVLALLSPSEQPEVETPKAQFASPIQPAAPSEAVAATLQTDTPKVLPVRATLTDEDSAVLDALSLPLLATPDIGVPPSTDGARAHYAFSGVWVLPPKVPKAPETTPLDDLYLARVDPISTSRDAIALPDIATQQDDISLPVPSSPAVAGTQFELNGRGLVAPSDDGTVNPDGVRVFTGPPPAEPPQVTRQTSPAVEDPRFAGLEAFRPRSRPAEPVDTDEPATTVGPAVTVEPVQPELIAFRPQGRPAPARESTASGASLVPLDGSLAATERSRDASPENATAQAVASSLRPDARPKNYKEIVASSRSIASAAGTLRTAEPVRTASVAPRTVAPKIPSSASVKREATVKNAINLRRVNLIGVYGKPAERRALVRLANGRYQKVKVGDRIDGGRISAIGDAELRYQKSGRNLVLKMPKG